MMDVDLDLLLGGDQDLVADHPDRIGANAPFRLHGGGAGRQLEAPLVPRAVDELEVAHHDGVTGGVRVDDVAAARAAQAQRPALVRAVVGDGVERPVDVVDADAVPSDGDDLALARLYLVVGGGAGP